MPASRDSHTSKALISKEILVTGPSAFNGSGTGATRREVRPCDAYERIDPMDRRVTALAGLLASGLICIAADSFAAATHCNPDYVYTWTTVQSASKNVSAPAPAKNETPANNNTASTASAAGGGDEAGSMGEGGGGGGVGIHKRGLRWQSFLPGMIK